MTDEEFTKKLNAQCDKFKNKPFNVDGKYNILTLSQAVKNFFRNSFFYNEPNPKIKFDYAVIYGHNVKNNEKIVKQALNLNIPILLCEDGFIRGYDTYANKKQDPKYREQCSLTIDRVGFHYDATRKTDILNLLSDYKVSEEQAKYARKLINRILSQKITKYNHQPERTRDYGRPGRKKVLVVDQSYNDWSIKISGGSEKDFELMLRRAVEENPDCDILVKVHPDTIIRKKISDSRLPLGYYENVKEKENVFVVADGVNPYSLLEIVDDVYVYSTQLGFEAVMAGKKVHTFGTPFYAGWGLTEDNRKFPDRKRALTVEEMFYIVYCVYTKWYDPVKKQACGIEQGLDYINFIKKDYANNTMLNHSISWCTDADLNNNIMALQSIKSFMANTTSTKAFYIITCRDNPFVFYFKKIPGLRIVFADDFISNFKCGEGRLSKFAYARLMLLDKKSEFAKYKFNIYVDNDAIAVRGIDKNLIGVGNSLEKAIAIVKESPKNNISLKNMKEFCVKSGLEYDCSCYGNTGVLLINNSQITDNDLDECVKLAKLEFPLCDQGLLNYHFQGRIQNIKGKYNSCDFTDSGAESAVIKHYPNSYRKTACTDLFSKYYIEYVFNGLSSNNIKKYAANKNRLSYTALPGHNIASSNVYRQYLPM